MISSLAVCLNRIYFFLQGVCLKNFIRNLINSSGDQTLLCHPCEYLFCHYWYVFALSFLCSRISQGQEPRIRRKDLSRVSGQWFPWLCLKKFTTPLHSATYFWILFVLANTEWDSNTAKLFLTAGSLLPTYEDMGSHSSSQCTQVFRMFSTFSLVYSVLWLVHGKPFTSCVKQRAN